MACGPGRRRTGQTNSPPPARPPGASPISIPEEIEEPEEIKITGAAGFQLNNHPRLQTNAHSSFSPGSPHGSLKFNRTHSYLMHMLRISMHCALVRLFWTQRFLMWIAIWLPPAPPPRTSTGSYSQEGLGGRSPTRKASPPELLLTHLGLRMCVNS